MSRLRSWDWKWIAYVCGLSALTTAFAFGGGWAVKHTGWWMIILLGLVWMPTMALYRQLDPRG